MNPNKRTLELRDDPPLEVPAAKSKRTPPKKPLPAVPKPKKKARAQTPLQKFREQTIKKRKDLKLERKRIDADLRAIEKDLGVLKRK